MSYYDLNEFLQEKLDDGTIEEIKKNIFLIKNKIKYFYWVIILRFNKFQK